MSFWIAGAGLALGVTSAMNASSVARAGAGATVAAVKANQEIDKYNQQAENANSSLANFVTAMNNSRRLKSGGEAFNASNQNVGRNAEHTTASNLEQVIAASERAGAYAANAASKGQRGNAVAIVDMAMQLRDARARRSRETTQGYVNYDTVKQLAGLQAQTVDGLDLSVHSGGSTKQATTQKITGDTDWAGILSSSGIIKPLAGWMSGLGNSPAASTAPVPVSAASEFYNPSTTYSGTMLS